MKWAIVAIVGLSGCDGTKHGECAELTKVINAGLSDLENGQQQAKNDPTKKNEMRAMADALDRVAAETAKLSLTIPTLKQLSGRYQVMVRDAAKHARTVADAVEKQDTETVAKSQSSLHEALRAEDPIVSELNKFCNEP